MNIYLSCLRRELSFGSTLMSCSGERGPCAFIFQQLEEPNFTFATSVYKQLLSEVHVPKHPDELRAALDNTLQGLSLVQGANIDPRLVLGTLTDSIDAARDYMRQHDVPLGIDPSEVIKFEAKLLWTAPLFQGTQQTTFGGRRDVRDVRDIVLDEIPQEVCWCINKIIRVNE